MEPAIRSLPFGDEVDDPHEELLDRVFFALSDPVRRAILKRLGERHCLVSELAAPFDISLQAVSRHVQVLVQAGLVQQERTGRIARCRLEVGAMFAAAVWINEYSRYWQAQFDALARWLKSFERGRGKADRTPERRRRSRRVGRTAGAPRDQGPAGRDEQSNGGKRNR
jgi:DNA-binding transcriptional ArsR family regulator